MREEENKNVDSIPTKELEEQVLDDPVQNEDPAEPREEDQLVKEDYMDKVKSHHETVEDTCDSPLRDNKLSFLHSTKYKFDSILQVDSRIYNKIMGLKRKPCNIIRKLIGL